MLSNMGDICKIFKKDSQLFATNSFTNSSTAHNVGGDEIELTNNLNIVGPQFSILICILGLGLAVNKNKRRRES